MHDAQQIFALNEDIARQHEVGVLGHGSRQRVFNRNDGRFHRSAFEAIENLRRAGAGHNHATGQHPFCRLVTE